MKNILEYLEKTAPRFPDRPALCDEESVLSFGEFLRLSRVGGSELLRRGLYHEPVVVFMKKCPQTICAFFSVIYAGCYYIPVDIGMPQQRIQMILEKLNPRAVIYDESGEELLRELGYGDRMLACGELFSGSIDEALLSYVRSRALDIDPIYIVFTSGSTGMPKGVTACHRSVIDYAEAICPVIGSDETSVFAMQVPLFVDACLKELLSVIRCGSEAWLMPQNLFMSPLAALDYLNRHHVNTLCWVASALTMISGFGAFEDVKPAGIRTVCFSSEVFPVKQLRLWQEACPGARFINFYGPTECTGISFYYVVDHEFDDTESVPVGRPFDNTDYILLTDDDTEAAPGEQGEICIRGTCVTLGYYHLPHRRSRLRQRARGAGVRLPQGQPDQEHGSPHRARRDRGLCRPARRAGEFLLPVGQRTAQADPVLHGFRGGEGGPQLYARRAAAAHAAQQDPPSRYHPAACQRKDRPHRLEKEIRGEFEKWTKFLRSWKS